MNNKELTSIFKDVGKEYGFENVSAEFVGYADFKVKWTRSYKWADFQVSDYLDKADPKAIEGVAHALFSRIAGKFPEDGPAYPPALNRYLLSEDLIKNYLDTWIRRHNDLQKAPEYLRQRITDIITKEFGEPISDLTILWTSKRRPSMSALFRTIAANDGISDKEIAECYKDMLEGIKQLEGN